jgi:hypothetical protein
MTARCLLRVKRRHSVVAELCPLHPRRLALDERANLFDWRLHEVRRNAATVMADRLGVLPRVIEAVMNHISGHRAGVQSCQLF